MSTNTKRFIAGVITLSVVFLLIRSFGLSQIYHADEHSWIQVADPIFNNFAGPHPPLMRYLLRYSGFVFGFNHLRVVPFIIGFFDLLLVIAIAKKVSNSKKIALFAGSLFAINIYSLIASLQVDIDGVILPFFVLLGYLAYILWRQHSDRKWLVLLFIAIAGGLLTKLSYVLFLGALSLEHMLLLSSFGAFETKKIFRRAMLYGLSFIGLGVVALAIYYFGHFHIYVVDYALHFKVFNFRSRAYLDLSFKILKSIVWLSPLLLLPALYGFFVKDIFQKQRFWYIYLALNFVFYSIVFDFATLDVQRYFMFAIAPSALIAGDVLAYLLKDFSWRKSLKPIILGLVGFVSLSYVLLSFKYEILPLNPKIAYLQHIKHLDLNFLIPFSGGSGPIGFYFSALFILGMWLVSFGFIFSLRYFKRYHLQLVIFFIIFGLGYNIIFDSEFLFGGMYGSPANIARQATDYINNNSNIKSVITYNDIGVYDLIVSGKYASRFFTAPKRDYRDKITDFRGHYMIVDFPLIDKPGKYWPLITRCPQIKTLQDKDIKAYIFDCTNLPK